jgi:hypothetical protein
MNMYLCTITYDMDQFQRDYVVRAKTSAMAIRTIDCLMTTVPEKWGVKVRLMKPWGDNTWRADTKAQRVQ